MEHTVHRFLAVTINMMEKVGPVDQIICDLIIEDTHGTISMIRKPLAMSQMLKMVSYVDI